MRDADPAERRRWLRLFYRDWRPTRLGRLVSRSLARLTGLGLTPPVLLAFSVFLAIRDAVAACGGPGADPPLRAPATAEAILCAIHAVRRGD